MAGGILGTKLGMTQIFNESGECIPVTVVRVGPCTVTQKKSKAKEGYAAVQIGFQDIKDKHLNKPQQGHFKANGLKPQRHLREFRISDEGLYDVGLSLDITLFQAGDKVDVSGQSKGKGFQGVIKRHGHAGGPGAHGSRFHRAPGSIGQNTSPGEVAKGTKLPGHMGGRSITVRNLEVVGVRSEEQNLLLRGAVPGPNGGLVFVRLSPAVFEQRIQGARAVADEAGQEKAVESVEAKAEEANAATQETLKAEDQ